MRISKATTAGKVVGYIMHLSASDTYAWARKPGAAWPCSECRNNRIMVSVDGNGLCDFTMNGKSADMDGTELDAIVSDHLPADCRHLWPVWAGLGDVLAP